MIVCKTRYGSYDVLRSIMAFIVIANHSMIFGEISNDLISIPVPVFYMISGYFCYRSDGINEHEVVKKQFKKCVKVLLMSYVFYAIFHIVYCGITRNEYMFSISTLYTCCNLFCPPLWYLHSYVYMLLLILLLHTVKIHLNNVISPLFVSVIIISAYVMLHIKTIPMLVQHVYCYSLAFYILGQAMKKYENLWKNRFRLFHIIILLILITVIGFINRYYQIDVYQYTIATILISMNLFILFGNINISAKKWIAKVGRKYSLHVYIFHWIFVVLLNQMFSHMPLFVRLIYPLILLVLSLSVSVVYKWILSRLCNETFSN